MDNRIYINDQLVDMMPGTVIAITIQVNNIAELKDRQASYSNRIKLPKSRINNAIFENANMFQANSTVPYSRLKITLIQGGIETVANGVGVLSAVSNEFYELIIYAGLVDFFNKIKDLKLNDLDLSGFLHEKDIVEIRDKINATSGFVYPLIDYGVLMEGTRDFTTNDEIDDNFWPGFYLHTLIKEIIEQAGFSFSGDIFSDSFFNSLILPFTNDVLEVNETFEADSESEFNSSGIWFEVLASPTFSGFIPFVNKTTNNNTITFNNGFGLKFFENFLSDSYRFQLTFEVTNTTSADIPFVAGYLINAILSPITDILPEILIPANSTLTVTANIHKLILTPSDVVRITATAPSAGLVIKATTALIGLAKDYVVNTFPDINQSELLKEFMQMFGLVPDRDKYSTNIDFFQFDILETNKALAKKWSKKYQKNTDTYIPTWTYAQNNFFKWATDADIEAIGSGLITSNNVNLKQNKDVVKSGFEPSESVIRLDGLNIAQVLKFEDDNFTGDVGLRLLASYEASLATPITLLTAPEPNPRITYFIEQGRDSLDWQELVNNNYDVINNALQDTKVLTAKFRLSADDINNFDFSIPVYIDYFGSFFYVNIVSNYQPNKLTSVELIKI